MPRFLLRHFTLVDAASIFIFFAEGVHIIFARYDSLLATLCHARYAAADYVYA